MDGRTTRRAVAAFFLCLFFGLPTGEARSGEPQPWKAEGNALIVDAYELNAIDWSALVKDKRIAAFISKASDGLPESFSCNGEHKGDTFAHCKTMWRKYAVSRELFHTRRMIARAGGLLWGAYHLARPGNPIDQANHFLEYAAPASDELMVLDIEGLDPEKFMSLDDAQIFAGHIKARTGRYPILYTNHDTAKYIAAHRRDYAILSRLPLWYARYRPDVRGVFPLGNWDSYALWQFASATNCSARRCPYRVAGTLTDIDVNVAAMSREQLAKVWPFGDLIPARLPDLPLLVARASARMSAGSGSQVALDLVTTASVRPIPVQVSATNYQDF